MGAALSQLFRPPELHRTLSAPDHIPDQPQAVQTLSKNARKKLARQRRLQERKEARKAQRRELKAQQKIKKRQEREEALKHLTKDERESILRERIEHIQSGRAAEREKKAHVRSVLENHTKYNVCIDLGWNEQMFDKERKSLARQLAYSYSALRKAVEEGLTPVHLSIVGVDDVIRPALSCAAQGWDTWPVVLSEKGLVEVYDKKRLVYLTHDAEDVLETLDPSDVYVIGGLVDRNRLKGVTRQKADALSLRSARLNLNENISIQHGTPVLTVNHCVEILLHTANGLSWKDAYLKVLPLRKGVKSC
ncbi:tRNA (guanine(9)-N1)-methyltransferase [Gracilariopsis chorda]|uniref:tRNA (guanine(9)-N(1))-methyltransferase n=1 Tax=Gracilariopsis chorda TaxID=448386 RepID=A0A2V3IPA8_9FLOR|nr:tRNA (guanine(9)-N1)-methyltransferase [Gracilariopsis chorda]|eukprot:PXF43893.1 tRNA (guanine(9)-N1)-methyltransferase [Gracilariopsis chorda]